MSDNNTPQNQFGKRKELGGMPDFPQTLRNSEAQPKQDVRIPRNPNLIDNGFKPMTNEPQFNHQQYNQMPVTIENSNQFTNRQFPQSIPNKMMSNLQPFSSPQPISPQIPQQDLFAQIAEMKKMIDELKNDSLKKDEEIRTLFKNSGKLPSSIVGLSRDEDDEFQIFAPIPLKSELQAELQDLLILQAQHNGSDMHLKVGSAPMIRIEGELVPVGEESLTPTDLRRLLLPLLTKKQKEKLVQDGQPPSPTPAPPLFFPERTGKI